MGNVNRKRIKLPSGLELVRRHIAAVVHREDGGVTVCVDGFGQYCLTGDAAAFHAWWDAPKAKRVKADATPEPPAEPKAGPWVATHGFMDRVARVTNLDGEPWIQIHAAPRSKHVELDALAERVARLLNESEVTG